MNKKNPNNHLPPLLDTLSSVVPAKHSPEPKNIVLSPPVSAKFYPNSDTCKEKILSDNQNKAGIYKWTNRINGKQYIGSSINLSERLSSYYSTTYMEDALKRGISHIYRALLKNGHSKFSLEILEYCSPDKCLEREDLYLSSLKPEYNINKKATAPFLGRKHSGKTKQILSDANTSLFFNKLKKKSVEKIILCLVRQERIILIKVNQEQKEQEDLLRIKMV